MTSADTPTPTLLARIAAAAGTHPDRPGLVMDTEILTHADIEQLSKLVGRGLVGAGYGRGRRIAVLSPNHLMAMVATVGTIRSGATWIPLNPRESVETIGELCRRFGVDLLVYHPELVQMTASIAAATPNLAESVPFVADATSTPTLLDWEASHAGPESLIEPALEDIVAVFATGGTTGTPKGVCYSYRTMSAIAGNFVELLDHPDPVFLAAAPLTHVSGRVCLGVMAAGGTTVVLPHFDPGAVFEAIERHRITTMMLPTTLLTRLLAHPAARSTDTSSLRRISVGASPVPVDLIKRAIEVFGPVVAQNYGQTEAPMHIASMRPDEYLIDGRWAPDERLASCGRPTRYSEVRVVGPDGVDRPTGEVGEVGEIVLRSNFVMDGYLDDEAATLASRIDGWHRTGDLGTLDDEGYLRIVGRLREMIITGGFNVYPAEVEGVLAERPEVHESAVVGVPDPDWGERVVAVVEPSAGRTCDTTELQRHVRSRLGGVKTPKEFVIVDSLPRNTNGKILKRALADELAARDQPRAG